MPNTSQRRQTARNRGLRARKPLDIEQLENRVVPTVIDLTTAGATGALNGALFFQSSGTGIDTFVRLATNQTVEQGYNTNFRPVQFDESTNSQNTHAEQLSSVPTVVSAGGLAYYEFLLDINQLSSSPLLSVDELRFYVTNSSTVDPTLLHNYSVTAPHTLQDDGGHLYSPVYDLNPTTPAGNYIELNYKLATGNSTGDMVALIPVTSLGTDLTQYVYLYSELGVHFANNDGSDAWSTADALPVGSISGVKFVDVNGNGVRDSGDPAMAGVTVFLDANNNGVLDPGEVSTVSAADGSFSFSRLLAGTYHVREVAPAGWIQTASINTDLTLAPGQNATGVAMGDFKLITVSGTKFEDRTGDGFSADDSVLNSANPDFVPVTMQLLQGSTVVATTSTGNDGTYTFTGVGPGIFTVSEVKPNGWIQTGAKGTTFTAMSGIPSTGNDFDNFLVAYLSGNALVVRTTLTGSGTLTLVQNNSTNTIDVSESTASLASQSAGSFAVPGISSIQITSNRGYTVNTNQVVTVPIVDNAQPGGSTLQGGASGTTVMLNSGSTDSISVTGGQNTLSFAPTTFGVTFNAGIQSQFQSLDSSNLHFLSVTGPFQTLVGTNFNDTLTAVLPTFNTSTGAIGQGTTIFSGIGQDTIYGSLGTNAETDGASSSYTQVLSTAAIGELQSAIAMFGGSATNLGGFGSTVKSTGGFSSINVSLLTGVTVGGTQNTVNQSFSSSTAPVLQAALASFGISTSQLGGFGGSMNVSGGFNVINTSALANVSVSGGTNTVVQSIDPNAAGVLNNVIASFGNTAGNAGGFGDSLKNLGGFGGTTSVAGGFNQVQTTLLANVNLSAGTNTYIQTVDANAAQVLTVAVQNLQSHFGSTAGNSGGFGGLLNDLGGLGNVVTASGGTNAFGTSILTSVTVTGGNTTYVQSLDANSAQILEAAITGFGNTVGAAGGFGNSLGTPGGFGNTVGVGGGFNQVQTSVMTSVNFGGGNNTYIQSLDANSAQVLEAAITGFGSSSGAGGGGFGGTVNTLGGFGNAITNGGGFNKIRTSILTNITINGSNNLYLEALDDNSRQVLDAAINAYGNSVGVAGGFGNSLTTPGGFGNSLNATGGFNQVEASLLTTVNFGGGNDVYLQVLDNNSAQVLETAIAGFGNASGAGPGGFGAGLNNLGGFGNSTTITGGLNQLETSILTTVTITGSNNFYLQTLDANSTAVLDQAIASYGSSLGNSGGFGNSTTTPGGFGNAMSSTGGFNTVQVSLMTSVTLGGGYNLYTQTLDANSVQVLNTALTTIASFGGTAGNLGGFGNTVGAAGGYNTAQAGILTTINLSGGFDTLVEQLTPGDIGIAATAVANAPSQGKAAVAKSIGLTGKLGDGDDVIVGGLLGTFTAGNGNDRFVIEDSGLLGLGGTGTSNGQLLQFGGVFTAGTGNNTYYFVGQNLGHIAVNQAASAGIDALNFSRFQAGGITLFLGQTGEQTLTPGLLFLTLSDGMGFSNVVGTGLSDTITLNGRNGTTSGQALLDPLAANTAAPHAVPTQYVFLDFDTYTTDPTTQHVYTLTERQAILAILQSDYALFPFVQFTLTAPTSGSFETVFFNRPTGTSEGGTGGNSSKIDFRDLSQSATAEVNVNGFIGTGPGEIPATDPVTGQDNWVTVSATIAAHETGHILGEQHEFSMGPVGFGINNPPGNAAYRPSYPGPDAAWETAMHIMASPASVGSTLQNAAGHPFFGEREAIALAYINDGTVVDNTQIPVANNSKTQAQSLNLVGLQVPNPATSGFEANMQYSVAATDVVDYIGLDSTGHSQDKWYSFTGKQGDLMNFDVMSYHLTRITDPVDTVLTIYDSLGNVVTYYNSTAMNDDNFETADAHIIDLTLPASGTYYVNVDSFTDPTIQPGQPGYNPGEATDTLTGHYELLIYRSTVGNKISTSSHDTVVLGSGQATIYGVDPSNPMVNPQAVTYSGVEGTALSLAVANFSDPGTPATGNFSAMIDWGDGNPASAGTVSISGSTVTILGSHAYAEEGTYTTTLTINEGSALSVIMKGKSVVADAPLSAASSNLTMNEGVASNTQIATFTDQNPRGPISDFTATIAWGDGSTSAGVITQPNGVGTAFTVTGSHAYAIPGSDTVKVTITDVGGATTSTSFVVTVQPSIIVLNLTVSGALTLTGSVGINIAGAVVVDSSSASGLTATGSSKITAGTIQVVGGVSASNGVILSPTPVTGIKVVADPLAGLAAPPNASNFGSLILSKGSKTISPGVYTQISVSGNGTTLTMNPGVYIIAGGGFSVSNSASVNGTGVTIYNTGSNFPVNGTDSGTFGAISLGSSGSVNLSAPTTGSYAGILIFQSRNNTRAMSLNASSVVGLSGVIYAPNALLSLGGSATLKTPAIVGQLTLNGNGGSSLTSAGSDNSSVSTAGQLLGNDLFLYVNDPSGFFTADELARLADIVTGLDNLLAPYSVTITEVSDATLANLILDTGSTSAAGGLADGVLGCYVSDGVNGEITLIQGWNWYTGADPSGIATNQYDFQTILTHEMGHALGLGHSTSQDSVMNPQLATSVVHRSMTVQDLNIPDPGTGPDGLHAALPSEGISKNQIPSTNSQVFGIDPFAKTNTFTFQSGTSSVGLTGFGFSVADFSAERLTFAFSRINDLQPPLLDPRQSSMPRPTDLISTFGLNWNDADLNSAELVPAGVPDTNIEDRMPSVETVPPPQPAAFDPPTSTLKPQSSTLWDASPTLPEITLPIQIREPSDSNGSHASRFWDLEETAGWLLFGMFVSNPKSEDRNPKHNRVPKAQNRN